MLWPYPTAPAWHLEKEAGLLRQEAWHGSAAIPLPVRNGQGDQRHWMSHWTQHCPTLIHPLSWPAGSTGVTGFAKETTGVKYFSITGLHLSQFLQSSFSQFSASNPADQHRLPRDPLVLPWSMERWTLCSWYSCTVWKCIQVWPFSRVCSPGLCCTRVSTGSTA